MIIKKPNNRNLILLKKFLKFFLFPFKNNLKLKFYRKLFVNFIFFFNVLILISIGIFFNSDSRLSKKILIKIEKETPVLNILKVPEIFWYKVKGLFFFPKKIEINVNHNNMQLIEFERQNAINGKIDFNYVNASLVHANKKYKVKLRLKGKRNIHYKDVEKTSFRIEAKGDETIFGMKNFSIHKPRSRNYIEEFVYLKMMSDEGIITPRYEFINVILNGKNNGVYALEEHYTKYLIENNKHKDGPILAFEESESNFMLEKIKVFDKKKWTKSSDSLYVEKAISLLEGFKSKKLKIKDVFDEKKLAKFFAISDLNYAWHGAVYKSMRFYYNPVSSKLEPIPYDGHRGVTGESNFISSEFAFESETWLYKSNNNWFKIFFNNNFNYSKVFYSEYISTLERLSNKKYLDHFFEKHNKEISNNLKLIYGDFPLIDNVFSYGPGFYYFDKKTYYNAQNNILNKLKKNEIQANLSKVGENFLNLDITNRHKSLPYEILYVSIDQKNIICNPYNYNVIVAETPLDKNIRNQKNINFNCSSLSQFNGDEKINLFYKYPGGKEIYSVTVDPWRILSPDLIKNDIVRKSSNIEEFDFIKIDDSNKKIIIREGRHTISKNLIVPRGYTFLVENNTILNFTNNAIILSHSKCEWIGTKDKPISIVSENGDNGSIIVFNHDQSSLSKMSFINFNNLSFPKINDWNISGSLNFYNGHVDLDNITFKNNNAEDALNLINTVFKLENLHFENIKSDAIDIDFGKGNIIKSSFNNIGNDAIDVSGTTLSVENIITFKTGDKALSAGENSIVNGNNFNISNSEIGIASKDGSKVFLNDVNIYDSKLGLTSFVKKNEYSNASLIINNLVINKVSLNYLVEKKSFLKVNENVIYQTSERVKNVLYGNEYGLKTEN